MDRRFRPEEPGGWFAYEPSDPDRGSGDHDDEVTNVELMAYEYAGPFWSDEGHLSDEFDDLHRWLGISREVYDDAMSWNADLASVRSDEERAAHRRRGEALAERIRAEVPAGIAVSLRR